MRVVGSGDHAHRTHSNWEHIWTAYDSAGEANTAIPMWSVANKEPFRDIRGLRKRRKSQTNNHKQNIDTLP